MRTDISFEAAVCAAVGTLPRDERTAKRDGRVASVGMRGLEVLADGARGRVVGDAGALTDDRGRSASPSVDRLIFESSPPFALFVSSLCLSAISFDDVLAGTICRRSFELEPGVDGKTGLAGFESPEDELSFLSAVAAGLTSAGARSMRSTGGLCRTAGLIARSLTEF